MKRATIVVVLVLATVFGWTQQGATEEYEVGAIGPAGGRIFYDKGHVTDGWRYLEAAPVEAEFTADWGAYLKEVGGTATDIGTGKRNTELIVEFLRRNGENGKAAQLCDSLNIDGYDDWFLPSRDELNLMYTNLKAKGLGEFGAARYWSSSEYSTYIIYDAWVQRFNDGSQGPNLKNPTSSVRAVRAF